jgi:hypothetical protein
MENVTLFPRAKWPVMREVVIYNFRFRRPNSHYLDYTLLAASSPLLAAIGEILFQFAENDVKNNLL